MFFDVSTRANVQVNYTIGDGAYVNKYEATVKLKGRVISKYKSGDDIPLTNVRQYEVEQVRAFKILG